MSGEYAILDGAYGFALPTKLGQSMLVKNSRGSDLVWECFDKNGNQWFKSHISLYDFSAINTSDQDVSDKIQKILKNAVRQNSEFLSKWNGFKVQTTLEFDQDWGLGSSSTLYALVAEWADVNPLVMFFKIENGSGYDVACSSCGEPILYISNDEEVSYTPVTFENDWTSNLYFVHLNKKQDSGLGIREYLKAVKKKKEFVAAISDISKQMIEATNISTFSNLMDKHEELVAHHTGFKKVKDLYFSDFEGSIKSLGAWGGDFAMIASSQGEEKVKNYFSDKQFNTVLKYDELIKQT